MRRGMKQDVAHFNDRVCAVSLGADFCAEHEWGIKRTQQDFGIGAGMGIERRRVTILPEHLRVIKFGGKDPQTALVYSSMLKWAKDDTEVKKSLDRETSIREPYRKEEPDLGLAAAWSDGDFCLRVSDSKNPDVVEKHVR